MSPGGEGAHEIHSFSEIHLQEKGSRLVLSTFLNTGSGENVFFYGHVKKKEKRKEKD